MVIRCKTNLIKDIPKEYQEYHQKTHDRDLNLTVGRDYIVLGIVSENNRLFYYAESDNGTVYWVAPTLFEIVDDSIPDDWVFRAHTHDGMIDFTISFPEWFEENFIWSELPS